MELGICLVHFLLSGTTFFLNVKVVFCFWKQEHTGADRVAEEHRAVGAVGGVTAGQLFHQDTNTNQGILAWKATIFVPFFLPTQFL